MEMLKVETVSLRTCDRPQDIAADVPCLVDEV
jgi:hypothetical protein